MRTDERTGGVWTRARVGTACAAVAAVVAGAQALPSGDRPAPTPVAAASGASAAPPSPPSASEARQREQARGFDRGRRSTSDPRSTWVVVNKRHPVTPREFRPELALVRGYQVATPLVGPLTRLLASGGRRGHSLKIASAFRSYGYQAAVHASTVAARGRAAADRVSARPGHSEHQTGLAVDLVVPTEPACHFDACFARTPAGRWLAGNAWRHGFLVRYQPSTSSVTGYSPEPWHLRYVGRSLAAEMRRTGVATLEEFFGVRGGDYRR